MQGVTIALFLAANFALSDSHSRFYEKKKKKSREIFKIEFVSNVILGLVLHGKATQ